MAVLKKCVSCGTTWSSALLKCPFCGGEGAEQQGPTGGARVLPPSPRKVPETKPAPAPAQTATEAPPEPVPASPTRLASVPAPLPADPGELATAPQRLAEPHRPAPHAQAPPSPAPGPAAPAPAAPALVELREPSWKPAFVLGLIGVAACAILPLTFAKDGDRILGLRVVMVGFLALGLLAPAAPLAWMLGERYSDRCDAEGREPHRLGRWAELLGLVATLAIVIEFSVVSLMIGFMKRGADSFWSASGGLK